MNHCCQLFADQWFFCSDDLNEESIKMLPRIFLAFIIFIMVVPMAIAEDKVVALVERTQGLIDADQAYLNSDGSFDAVIVSLLTSDSFIYRIEIRD